MEGGKFCRGVFWVIDGVLSAYPFVEGIYAGGTARSGVTYNHKKLWELVRGSRGKSYIISHASRQSNTPPTLHHPHRHPDDICNGGCCRIGAAAGT